jgi:hypothetical protein
MDLAQWLAELGLGQYAAAFTENDIDFDVLAQLTDADLKELGVSSLGNRKRLLAAIAASAGFAGPSLARGYFKGRAPASNHLVCRSVRVHGARAVTGSRGGP